MEKKIQPLFQCTHELIEEDKLSEALEVLNSLEPVDNYNERQKIDFYTLKSKIHNFLGDFSKSYETAEKAIESTKISEKNIETIDAFLNMAHILTFKGNYSGSMDLLEDSIAILNSLPTISERDRLQRSGLINLYKGYNYRYFGESKKAIAVLKDSIDNLENWGSQANLAHAYTYCGNLYLYIGELDTCFHYLSKSQKICENKESAQYNYPKIRNAYGTGGIHGMKGGLRLAVEYVKKGLSLARLSNNRNLTLVGLNNLGSLYQELGEWDQAIKFLNEALVTLEKYGLVLELFVVLNNLYHVYISKEDAIAARQVFHKMEIYYNQVKGEENKQINLFFQLNKAISLKMNKRARDLGLAQEIFEAIANDDVISVEMTQGAILYLGEILLDEFKVSQSLEALAEFLELVNRLKEAAEKQNSYKILAETYVLEAKLMKYFDLTEARRSLTKAQQIAERYGLKRLAISISNEHDNILKNLEMWTQMEKDGVPISDRFEKSALKDQILGMLKMKPIEIPDTSLESPILLLIMATSGLPLYTKIFSKEWKISEGLFSGFLSAFNSFSNQIFSEGLDRANFGNYTILMTGLPPFRSCYVFEGKSFLAQQKFSQFNTSIQNSEKIWQILTSADERGQVIQDGTSGGLGQLIEAIF